MVIRMRKLLCLTLSCLSLGFLSGPVFGTKGRGKASGGGLLRALEIGEVFSGLPFATSEKLNNFQAFALAVQHTDYPDTVVGGKSGQSAGRRSRHR